MYYQIVIILFGLSLKQLDTRLPNNYENNFTIRIPLHGEGMAGRMMGRKSGKLAGAGEQTGFVRLHAKSGTRNTITAPLLRLTRFSQR